VPVSFTIAVPTHDRRETVVLAVRSALAQTCPPEQVIVLCDGCTDGTAEALRALGDPRVEALALPKAPGYGYEHRNRSLELARGEAILWLADDDLLLPDHLERMGELWDTGRFDLVQSHAVLVQPDDGLEWWGADWSVPAQRARLERENSNPMASVSVRVELARAVGGWDPEIPRAADWDLWRRVVGAGARCAASPEATHLHFRARGREQAWSQRVRQNADWLTRIQDPAQLVQLRGMLRHTRAEHEARLLDRVETLETSARDAHRKIAEDHEHHAALLAHCEAQRQALEDAGSHVRELEDRLAASDAEAARLGETLARIEAGGWWRLRRRLLPFMRLAGRGR
jgi:glycosyltransferase involved in cell wall biosynthesis